MAARRDFPWPRLIAVAAGLCLVVGWWADSLAVTALAPVLGVTAWLLTRRQAASASGSRPAASAGRTAGGGKGRRSNTRR
jgi:hypothetical protein